MGLCIKCWAVLLVSWCMLLPVHGPMVDSALTQLLIEYRWGGHFCVACRLAPFAMQYVVRASACGEGSRIALGHNQPYRIIVVRVCILTWC